MADKIINYFNAYTNQRFQYWQKEHWERADAAAFIEANAAKDNALTRQGELQELKDWHAEQKRQFDESLSKSYEEMYQRFEKDGIDALERAIDRSSIGVKGVAKWTDLDDLKEQYALISAGASYLQNIDFDSVIGSNGAVDYRPAVKKFVSVIKKFTNFVSSMKLSPVNNFEIDENIYGKMP